jgi:hypothetical protein
VTAAGQRLAALEAEVERLKGKARHDETLHELLYAYGYAKGRESITGRPELPPDAAVRHLRAVPGGVR